MRATVSILILLVFALRVEAQTYGYSVASGNFEAEANQLVKINLEDGTFEALGYMGDTYSFIEGLAFSPDGKLFGADDSTKTLIRIVPDSGSIFPVRNVQQNLGFGNDPSQFDFGLSFSCDNNLYMVTKSNQGFYRVNPETGISTLIGNTGMSFTALAAWGDELYAIASGANNLYKINRDTGVVSVVGALGSLGAGGVELTNAGLSFDDSGQLWMLMDLRLSDPLNPFPSRVFKIDSQSGAATMVSETLVGVESLAIAPPGGCGNGPIGGPVVRMVPVNNPAALFVIFLLVLSSAFYFRRNKAF
ncbi:hypothetical protein [Marinicella sp. W31]|uniref:hypothetical protein n=1 Tax=Marinicella sp. W31 TaxID=3023713 RepID=UPI003756A6AC